MHTFIFQPPNLTYNEFISLNDACFEDEPVSEGQFDAMAKGLLWGVYDAGKIVGFAHMTVRDSLAWIARVAVAEKYRRRGIGRQLMKLMISEARDRGASRCILYTQQDNLAAMTLYRNFGFVACDTTYQYIAPAADLALMTGNADTAHAVSALPVDTFDPADLPEFPDQWSKLAESHNPPHTYVLMFRDAAGSTIGYCRLSPGFPGCFPFAIEGAAKNLRPALASLVPMLDPSKEVLRLTFSDGEVADSCADLGFELNYTLSRMELILSSTRSAGN